jgi:hypothetical protein
MPRGKHPNRLANLKPTMIQPGEVRNPLGINRKRAVDGSLLREIRRAATGNSTSPVQRKAGNGSPASRIDLGGCGDSAATHGRDDGGRDEGGKGDPGGDALCRDDPSLAARPCGQFEITYEIATRDLKDQKVLRSHAEAPPSDSVSPIEVLEISSLSDLHPTTPSQSESTE